MAIKVKLDDVSDYAPAIRELLPLAASGIKEAIFLIRDIASLWSQDDITPEQRAEWVASRKAALNSLLSHQFPPS